MEGNLPSGCLSHGADLAALRESSCPADVGLQDINRIHAHHGFKILQPLLCLTARHQYVRQLPGNPLHPLQVLKGNRLLQPAHTQAVQLRPGLDGRIGIPGRIGIHNQAARPKDLPGCLHAPDILFHAHAVFLVRHVAKRGTGTVQVTPNLDFGILIAFFHISLKFCPQPVNPFARCIKTSAGIGRYRIRTRAQKLIHRHMADFSQQIPECNVNTADCSHYHASAAMGNGAPVHGVPMQFNPRRVLVNQDGGQLHFHNVLHDSQRGPVCKCLTDSVISGVSLYPHKKRLSGSRG